MNTAHFLLMYILAFPINHLFSVQTIDLPPKMADYRYVFINKKRKFAVVVLNQINNQLVHTDA